MPLDLNFMGFQTIDFGKIEEIVSVKFHQFAQMPAVKLGPINLIVTVPADNWNIKLESNPIQFITCDANIIQFHDFNQYNQQKWPLLLFNKRPKSDRITRGKMTHFNCIWQTAWQCWSDFSPLKLNNQLDVGLAHGFNCILLDNANIISHHQLFSKHCTCSIYFHFDGIYGIIVSFNGCCYIPQNRTQVWFFFGNLLTFWTLRHSNESDRVKSERVKS